MQQQTKCFRGPPFVLIWTLVVLALASEARAQAAAPIIWMEGETPSFINVKPDVNASGRPQLLSSAKWLTVHAEPGEVEKTIPAAGVDIRYEFKVEKPATHSVWGRIGYEFARSPFDWRIDDGAWSTIKPADVTTDLTELSFFTEIGWRRFGSVALTAGSHVLEIRIARQKNSKGEYERLLFGLDALLLTPNPFLANGKFQPGQEWRDARDRKAEQVVFQLPEKPADGAQIGVALAGLWEVCRHDEDLPGKVAEPISSLPEHPFWRAIEVPGDKNSLRDDLVFAHRIWYRTRVDVPKSQAGRSFFLVFPQNNLNTTVYVNGVLCGFEKHPYVHFQIDVTKGVKPGVNEIWVGIRDAWYGYSASPTDPMKLRRHFNTPLQFTHSGFQDLAYPVWNSFQSGILATPTFASAGRVYVSDVFCKPSVAKKSLELEVTVTNPSGSAAAGDIICEAINAKTAAVEKRFAAVPFQFQAGGSATAVLHITEPWANPKLWWPDDPNMYRLRTAIRLGQANEDVSETPFGFREWAIDGKNFTLNGFVWHGWNMGIPGSTKEKWLENYRKLHQTQTRMCGASQGGIRPLFDMTPDDALDWCDREGVVVRRCGPLDGEAIGYFAVENDPELKKLYGSEIKLELLDEAREQMVAQVRGERNHPSVQIWSIENEWLYINCINLYGGLMDQFEAESHKVAEALKIVDPTRPCMTDGGGADRAQDMPVHGNHYVADPDLTRYPALAYESNGAGGGRGRWIWDEKRPRYVGEDFFYTGNHPELSTIGGEAAFGGKTSTLSACGLMLRILQQGYRWADFGAWDFYCGDGDADNSQWAYMAPRVALCREWDWTFASGRKVARTLAVFNDTHDVDPITVDMRLEVAGKNTFEESRELTVTPGQRKEFDLVLQMPVVDARQEGRLVLSLLVRGHEVWSDTKAVSILPDAAAGDRFGLTTEGALCVFDPAGGVTAFLKDRSLPFTAVKSLASLPKPARVLIVGKDAIDAAESTSSRLAAYASEGRAVIVLDQANPLKYQALPAEIESATNLGRVAFAEDLDHPAFRGLAQKDFFTWGGDEILYRNAYMKPIRGAKSLMQCGNSLQNSGLVEVQAGRGVMLLSQLVVGEKLSSNPVAQTLLENLIRYGATYKQVFRPVAAAVSDGSQLAKVLDAMGLQYVKVAHPLDALQTPGGIAVVEATPSSLETLAAHLKEIEQFTHSGGILLFNGLTPEGLASYNKIVGFEHMIRPFKRERVVFPAVRDPLTAGLTTGDVALYSSQRIFPWTEGNYVVSDEFSYVVDYDEVAPFGKSSFFAYDNIVNGFVNADGWPLIINFPMNKDGSPYAIPITLPKPQTITEFTWIGNTNYFPAIKLNLIFDGDASKKISYDVAPTGDPQVLRVDPPRTARQITLEIAAWQVKPGSAPLLGIDNIYLKAERPAEFHSTVKPMLNIGGMMHYVRGPGGIVLCNLKFQSNEAVPANAAKKQTILAALLRNSQARFSGGRSVIAGANLEYHPIDLSKQANQYRDEKGWFGEKQFTFRDLPLGKQRFAGVLYDVYDFATSPVPTVVMLRGNGVPGKLPKQVTGIPVGRRADALFFLHTARIDRPMSDEERNEKKRFELFHYLVHYSDGTEATVPVISQIGVDNYRQDAPRGLPEAQIGWSKPYEGTGSAAVAYSMQWNNPHPEKEIATIDVAYGADPSRGVPAVLAITAASGVAQ